jgi:hypothetical protein
MLLYLISINRNDFDAAIDGMILLKASLVILLFEILIL